MKSKSCIACVIALMLTAVGSRAASPEGCFPHPVALLKWRTDIYEQPDLLSDKIGHGEAARAFTALDSKLFGEDCWVQVRLEWKHEPPWGFLRDQNVTTGCVWDIQDDVEFEAEIKKGLDYLEEKAPRWHQYVTQHDYSIGPAADDAGASTANWPACTVGIDKSAFESDLLVLATHLVHEACHIHQYVALHLPYEHETYARVRNEMECYGRELDMLQEIAPEDALEQANVDKLVQKVEKDFRQSYWWWAKCRLHTPALDIPPDLIEGLKC